MQLLASRSRHRHSLDLKPRDESNGDDLWEGYGKRMASLFEQNPSLEADEIEETGNGEELKKHWIRETGRQKDKDKETVDTIHTNNQESTDYRKNYKEEKSSGDPQVSGWGTGNYVKSNSVSHL